MNEQKRQRLAIAQRVSNAREDAAELERRRVKKFYLSLHCRQVVNDQTCTIELTGADMPRQPMEHGYGFMRGVHTQAGVAFAPWVSEFPAVVTHLGIWNAAVGGEPHDANGKLYELYRPIVLQRGEVLRFPAGMGISATA